MKVKIKSVLVLLCYIGIIGIIPLMYVTANFIHYQLHVRLILVEALLILMIGLVYLGLLAVFMAIIGCSDMPKEVTETQDSRPNHEPVASNHGSNIQEVMENIRNNELEYTACFDLEGRKLAEGTLLSPHECSITAEDWRNICYRGDEIIKVHNHPGCSNVAFSAQDFKAFLQKDFIRKTLVVTKDYNYTMEKVGDKYETLQDDAKSYAAKMYTQCIWPSAFSDRLWSIVVVRRTAKKFGLRFKVERINQTPTRKIIPVGVMACVILMMFCFAKPQASASAVARYNSAADDPCFHGNTQTAGGQQDNIITEDSLANEIVQGYIDTPM